MTTIDPSVYTAWPGSAGGMGYSQTRQGSRTTNVIIRFQTAVIVFQRFGSERTTAGKSTSGSRISTHHMTRKRRDQSQGLFIWLRYCDGYRIDVYSPTLQDFCKEAVIWKHLTHPNIVPFLGAAMVTEGGRQTWEIVSEPMENGRIEDFLKLNQGVNKLELVGS